MSWGGNGVEAVAQNRAHFLGRMGLDPARTVSAEQVHGTTVKRIYEKDSGRGVLHPRDRIEATDGLVTNVQGLILTTLHADCAPVYYRDERHRAVGLAHAGWRGILDGLPGKMVGEMEREFGSSPNDLEACVGPMICSRHYEVTAERAAAFQARFGTVVIQPRAGKLYLDLWEALVISLLEAGLARERITPRPPCTFSNSQYPSYRRDGPPARSMLAWIMLT